MVSKAWAQRARELSRCIAIACGTAAFPVHAADIFVSVDSQGQSHYATQRLDASYRPLFRDDALAEPTNGSARAPQLQALIDRTSQRHNISRDLVAAVAQTESNLNARAVSSKGARGAMQLMPATAARYGLTPAQSLDAERNIDAGVRHLKDLLARYRGNTVLALAAYNAGAGAVQRHGTRVPPYQETMLYVPAVLARAATAPQDAR